MYCLSYTSTGNWRWLTVNQSVTIITDGQAVSIEGKRLCASGKGGSKSIIHMVSAWSNTNRIVLAQNKVDDKSNEIKAILQLLNVLMIKGRVITTDATL